MDKKDRFEALKETAEYQLRVLNEAEKISNRGTIVFNHFVGIGKMVDIYFGGVII